MDTDKGPEELYTEAKEVLALVGGSPSESPCSTGARRPPRSKHDQGTREEVVPSAEAHHRLLIGTVMLSKHSGAALRSPAHQLKAERAAVLTELNRAAAEVAELSTMIEEAERSVDLECSLIGRCRGRCTSRCRPEWRCHPPLHPKYSRAQFCQ